MAASAQWPAVVPYWAVWPFETMVLARRPAGPSCRGSPTRSWTSRAPRAQAVLTRYDNLLRPRSRTRWAVTGAADADRTRGWQLHAHISPPLLRSAAVKKFLVGYEMLGEPQRDLTPKQAAERLRSLSSKRTTGRPDPMTQPNAQGVSPISCAAAAARFAERFPGEAPARGRLPRPGQPDRRAHRLQRRLRPAHGHRPRGGASSSGRDADRVLRGHSVAYDETKELRARRARPRPAAHDWLSYVAGVFWAFAGEGRLQARGLDLVVDGDVPIGGGPFVLRGPGARHRPRARRGRRRARGTRCGMAKLGQKAENGYVGMNCGIMDQFASAACRRGQGAAARLPVARDAAGAGAARRGGRGHGHRRAPVPRGQRLQRPASRLRARGGRDREGDPGRAGAPRRHRGRARGGASRASTPPTSSAPATSSPRTSGRSRPRTRFRRATSPGPGG